MEELPEEPAAKAEESLPLSLLKAELPLKSRRRAAAEASLPEAAPANGSPCRGCSAAEEAAPAEEAKV